MAMQILERRENFNAVGDDLFDWPQPTQRILMSGGHLPDLVQRLPANILHHNITGQLAGSRILMGDEVEDANDVGVVDRDQEAAFCHPQRHRSRVLIIDQSLEGDVVAIQVSIPGQIDPTNSTARQATNDLILVRHQITRSQPRGLRKRRTRQNLVGGVGKIKDC
jgi:hypothetical protein